MALKVFIDNEFTDFFDIHLISLGMVAESGEEFYAEVPYPHKSCSTFVQEAVIPLLGQIPHAACQVVELRGKILSWLEIIKRRDEEVEICYDSEHDWDLFARALDGRIPAWCRPLPVADNINELLLYEFYQKNKLPEHHALYDARANQHAFRERR